MLALTHSLTTCIVILASGVWVTEEEDGTSSMLVSCRRPSMKISGANKKTTRSCLGIIPWEGTELFMYEFGVSGPELG